MGFELGESGGVIDTMLMSQVTENQETVKPRRPYEVQ
jgi:hypothetical protein